MNKIRNFVIIAHIDSGKSTLADRLLEITGTVDARHMVPQYLDKMDLERERGITIKMAPVRMSYKGYVLNLIDTPGHSDFSYEVSRALAAVEGAVLLIDGTKGIQAQTLSNLRAARKSGLRIIGAVNKIDLNLPYLEKTVKSAAELLDIKESDIFRISAKTGEGVEKLLEAVIENVPSPMRSHENGDDGDKNGALIFDSIYDDHKGILAFVRVFGGELKGGGEMMFLSNGSKYKSKEVGYFMPEFKVVPVISAGEIGYIATGLKEPSVVKIGDTITSAGVRTEAMPGYREPAPVVFISFYPDGVTKFEDLKKSLERLRLNDSALSFEPDANEALGRGLKVGFLGQLHFEITASRLQREFSLEFLTSFPSIAYRVLEGKSEKIIKQPQDFPEKPDRAWQPMIRLEILAPQKYLSDILNLKTVFDLNVLEIKNIGDNLIVIARMPLSELIRDFDDQLKSVSAGYASFSYELDGEEEADVEKLEILVVNEIIPALTRIVSRKDLEREGRATVERLKELLPKEQWTQPIQAKSMGRIIARETIPAMKKLLGSFGKTGGDRTRKMKLWKKQKRGKEKLKEMAKVRIPPETFREILKK
ncbi:MAG: translation elongation factor 4 [Patescibacteria group bacterium]